MPASCAHIDEIRSVAPCTQGCEECLKTGDSWVQLRLCLSCGHVGCCDSSPNKHATKHYRQTTHPIIQAFQSDDPWRWCYVDQLYL